MTSWNEIRKSATAFSKRWRNAFDEKSQAQSFLKEFFAVFGVDAVTVATFEHRVKFADGSQGYADCLWPGRILVEMKSRGKDLDAAFEQALAYVRSLIPAGHFNTKNTKDKEVVASASGRFGDGEMGRNPKNAPKLQNSKTPSSESNTNTHLCEPLYSLCLKTNDAAALPRAIVVSDFARVRFYDLANDCALTEFALKDLRKYVTLFGFMIGADEGGGIREQDPVNRRAAEKMARLHDAMKAVGYTGHPLEVYLVRLLFCLFAEDTGIFKPEQFSQFVARKTLNDGTDLAPQLALLFQTLNSAARLANLDESLVAFPYVNGGLFAETLPIAAFSAEMRKALLDCSRLDWSKISPAIFGAMFQGVMDEKARHDIGAHYTSEENILKLIRPLFLDGLRTEFEAICAIRGPSRKAKLEAFHEKIASLTFLDPACGCGNFLLIAYRELRRLEMDVLEELYKDDPGQFLDISHLCKVSVSQFYGIEIEPFAAEIAKVALWLMDHLCNMEVADRFGQYFARIPIKDAPHIVCANALRMDWQSILNAECRMQNAECEAGPSANSAFCIQHSAFSYIFGNPPFLGYSSPGMTADKKEDLAALFPKAKFLDFVCCWYKKASDLIQGTDTRCAFVSTNSITQGEQVGALWKSLNVEIDFAYRTFKWHNEAKGVAAVHCVIIGFHANGKLKMENGELKGPRPFFNSQFSILNSSKTIFDADGTAHEATHINGYLMDALDAYVDCPEPVCDVLPITNGSKAVDGGNLFLTPDDRDALAKSDPEAVPFIRRTVGADEFINGIGRFCLWLVDASPATLRKCPQVMERIRAVREYRLKSTKDYTRRSAARPALFQQIRQPSAPFIIIPRVSSETREYIPIGFMTPDIVPTDLVQYIPNATLYDFGVLSSRVHMAWVRTVAGRLKSDYRYSARLCYNSFVWPELGNVANVKMLPIAKSNSQLEIGNTGTGNTSTMATIISSTAQAILDARAAHPESTLADLYDPLAMPADLRAAHEANDRAVLAAYGLKPDTPEPEIVAHLFKLYAYTREAK